MVGAEINDGVATGQSGNPNRNVMIYVPPYGIPETIEMLQSNFDGCSMQDAITHIALQFWVPLGDKVDRVYLGDINRQLHITGSETPVRMTDTNGRINAEVINWFRKWAADNSTSDHKIRVMMAIYNVDEYINPSVVLNDEFGIEKVRNWNWNLAKLSFRDHREAFVSSIITELTTTQLDGVEIDFEGPGTRNVDGQTILDEPDLNGDGLPDYDRNNDQPDFVLFLVDLSNQLKQINKCITCATFGPEGNHPNHTWWTKPEGFGIMDWVDAVNIMIYEGGGAPAPNEPYYNCSLSEYYKHYECLIPLASTADKLMIGVDSSRGDWLGMPAEQHLGWLTGREESLGIAIWDAQLSHPGWRKGEIWRTLAEMNGHTCSSLRTAISVLKVLTDSLQLPEEAGLDLNHNTKVDTGDAIKALRQGHISFDGEVFDDLTNPSNWLIRDSSIKEGPESNYWNKGNVIFNTTYGVSVLTSKVENNERHASQLTFIKKQFPIVGTYAARIKIIGTTGKTQQSPVFPFHQSVKAFFTYTSDPPSYPHCDHVENDFEIITEKAHSWGDSASAFPQMTINTHLQDSDGTCDPEKDPVPPTVSGLYAPLSISDDDNSFVTLVLRVSKISSIIETLRLRSEYYMVKSDGREVFLGASESDHGLISSVAINFNNWWLDPELLYGHDFVQTPIYFGPQYLYVDWTYYHPDPTMNVIVVHNRGEELSEITPNDINLHTPTVETFWGQVWMDRNLGAARAPQDLFDYMPEATGDYFQWGRSADGHEKSNSEITYNLSTTDQPDHSSFIALGNPQVFPFDWRFPPNNNLWQGQDGINNPCPSGFRIPTIEEWITVQQQQAMWPTEMGPFPIIMSFAGDRSAADGTINGIGGHAFYWSSSTDSNNNNHPKIMIVNPIGKLEGPFTTFKAFGGSLRCIKN